MEGRFELSTARLVLIGADEALLRAELGGHDALAAECNAIVPASWPPEHHDRGAIEWVLSSLDRLMPSEPWRLYYIVLDQPRTLIGTCGIKQAPDENGCVEVGYSVLDHFRCRGFASEAVMGLMSLAFARGASEVAAETYPSLVPSLKVMQKCGMTKVGEGAEPNTVRYTKRQTVMITHTGGCHCGRVRFEVRAPAFLEVSECNCSICAKSGYLHLTVPSTRFRLIRGGDQLTAYQFNTRTAKHLFCSHCGIKSFYVPRSHPDGFSVNARCLDEGTVDGMNIRRTNGKEWEKMYPEGRGPQLEE